MRLYVETSVFGAFFDLESPGRIERTKMFFRATEQRGDR